MGFKGASVHTINNSGRISIPSKFRDILRVEYGSDSLVLAVGRSFIVVYPLTEWENLERKLAEEPPTSEFEANTMRLLYSSLEELTIDKQGRILISPFLRTRARLDGDCMIIGLNKRFEIWNKSIWEEEMKKLETGGDLSGRQFNELLL